MNDSSRILIGDTIEQMRTLPAACVQCCVTSPPYWGLRDYGVDGQIGLEDSPDAYVGRMVEVFAEVRRVLRDDGTLWLNLGDTYAADRSYQVPDQKHKDVGNIKSSSVPAGLKPKDLCMIPWRVALALQADGWWLRSVIVWAKKSPMPESVRDRPTSSWEPIFLLAKSERYFYDAEAVKEPLAESQVGRVRDDVIGGTKDQQSHSPGGRYATMPPIGGVKHAGNNGNPTYSGDRPQWPSGRNQRNVWHLGPEPYAEAHFATFPTEIPRRAIKAGTSEKGCCPACGAGWVRVRVRTGIVDGSARGSRFDAGKTGSRDGGERTQAGDRTLIAAVGWEPGCDCGAGDPVPCLVLDPFLGSGTSIAVARELGRHGVGCELNAEYAELARVRIGRAEKPTTFADSRVKGDAPLFSGGAA